MDLLKITAEALVAHEKAQKPTVPHYYKKQADHFFSHEYAGHQLRYFSGTLGEFFSNVGNVASAQDTGEHSQR